MLSCTFVYTKQGATSVPMNAREQKQKLTLYDSQFNPRESLDNLFCKDDILKAYSPFQISFSQEIQNK